MTDRTDDRSSKLIRGPLSMGLDGAKGYGWDRPLVTQAEREALAGHRGAVLWFTGLSGAGKTTIARLVDRRLCESGRRSFLLDGDVLRTGLNTDLGFSEDDRVENLRRMTEVGRLFAHAGVLVLVSAISPYESSREEARKRIGADRFLLIQVATPLSVCESRDVKGLYAMAREGKIQQFTGVTSPYEEPKHPDLRLCPEDGDPPKMVDQVMALLEQRGFLSTGETSPSG